MEVVRDPEVCQLRVQLKRAEQKFTVLKKAVGGLLGDVYRKPSRWFILNTISPNVAASRFDATAAE